MATGVLASASRAVNLAAMRIAQLEMAAPSLRMHIADLEVAIAHASTCRGPGADNALSRTVQRRDFEAQRLARIESSLEEQRALLTDANQAAARALDGLDLTLPNSKRRRAGHDANTARTEGHVGQLPCSPGQPGFAAELRHSLESLDVLAQLIARGPAASHLERLHEFAESLLEWEAKLFLFGSVARGDTEMVASQLAAIRTQARLVDSLIEHVESMVSRPPDQPGCKAQARAQAEPSKSRLRPSSSSTATPSSRALSSLLPASAPAMT
jgi:hypothetical protein